MGEITEKPSSISVDKNAAGKYSFKVKIYFEGLDDYDSTLQPEYGMAAVAKIKMIYDELHRTFK